MKKYFDINVYEAAKERIGFLFSEFDNIYVSFSGGKDSGVLLNLCVQYIRENKLNRTIGIFHIDYEAQYQHTTDYVDEVMESNKDIFEVYRVCLPVKTPCCTSMTQSYWLPWNKDDKDIWVRKMPKNAINEDNHEFDFWKPKMSDYEFQEAFSSWYHKHKKAKKTACLVGIRTQESLNRWRTIKSQRNHRKYKSKAWTTKMVENVYNAYPIYDWRTDDIWIANAKFGWSYNELYDLYYKVGLSIDQMRVASPFNDAAKGSLQLYKAIDPNMWSKMLGRVNGVNFTGIYGKTHAMGWNTIKKPDHFTWEEYMHFLLSTLPKGTKAGYLEKLSTSIKFWREKGGVLSKETIQKMKASGVKIKVSDQTNYKTEKLPVRMEYIDDIDLKDAKYIPTFKRMCICIMKNDHLCKYMGFSQTKDEMARRKNIIKKYQNLL